MTKLKVAIIGVGHLGSRHLKTYNELLEKVEIVGICDLNKETALELSKKYNVPFIEDYKQLINKVDAVNICVQTKSHYEISKFFLENGIHVLVEKPITSTIEQAEELTELSIKNKLILQVGHVERFNSGFQSVKRFLKHPLFIECHRLNHFPNRSLDIGVVMDLMIHDIDIVLGLVPSKIKDISAVGVNAITHLEDIASVRITFENNCVCNLTASRISDEVMRKIRVFQKDTYISLDYIKQEAFIYKRHKKMILKHSLPIEKYQPLNKELEHFIDCINTKTTPIVSGKEGTEALKVSFEICKKIYDNLSKFEQK